MNRVADTLLEHVIAKAGHGLVEVELEIGADPSVVGRVLRVRERQRFNHVPTRLEESGTRLELGLTQIRLLIETQETRVQCLLESHVSVFVLVLISII